MTCPNNEHPAATPAAIPCPVTAVYLFAGGGQSYPLYRKLLGELFSRARTTAPRVTYIGAANNDNREFFHRMALLLQAAGAGRIDHARLCGKKNIKTARVLIDAADVIFISGGDVEKGMACLAATQLIDVLRERADQGILFCGFSAGSIMLCREWIAWPNPQDDTSAQRFACLNIAPLFCDTHSEADNWPELQALLHLQPTAGAIGYGIPSGGALCALPNGTVSARGTPIDCFRRTEYGVLRESSLLPAA